MTSKDKKEVPIIALGDYKKKRQKEILDKFYALSDHLDEPTKIKK